MATRTNRPFDRSPDVERAAPAPDFSAYPAFDQVIQGSCEMVDTERLMVIAAAAALRPPVAVDVGTYEGGSAAALATHSDRVVTIDADPAREAGVAHLSNVEFRAGRSWEVLAQVLDEHGSDVGLVLLDADHTADGIRQEVEAVIGWQPGRAVAVFIHDVGMPSCREGLLSVDWAGSPWVHGVGLDRVPAQPGELAGGLGFVWLLPTRRAGRLQAQLDGPPVALGEPSGP